MLERIVKKIESNGWEVYSTSLPEGRDVPLSYSEMQINGPVSNLCLGDAYMVLPRPEHNRSLQEAVQGATLLGKAPTLYVPFEGLEGMKHRAVLVCEDGAMYFTHNLMVRDQGLFVMSMHNFLPGVKGTTAINIPYDIAENYFSQYFIISHLMVAATRRLPN